MRVAVRAAVHGPDIVHQAGVVHDQHFGLGRFQIERTEVREHGHEDGVLPAGIGQRQGEGDLLALKGNRKRSLDAGLILPDELRSAAAGGEGEAVRRIGSGGDVLGRAGIHVILEAIGPDEIGIHLEREGRRLNEFLVGGFCDKAFEPAGLFAEAQGYKFVLDADHGAASPSGKIGLMSSVRQIGFTGIFYHGFNARSILKIRSPEK